MLRPRVKYEHQPVRYGDNAIGIGGEVPGIGSRVHDPDGWLWQLLALLDGAHTVDEIVRDLVERFPAHPDAQVREAIADFVEAGYVEDAAATGLLGDRARERYDRGMALLRWMDRTPGRSSEDVQARLHQARVVVVGLGGAGGAAAEALAGCGVGHIHCVDADVVQLSNLNRQFLYTEDDIGLRKVDVAVRRLRRYNSDITITGEALDVDGPAALHGLVTDSDVLLLTADRPAEIRSWANVTCHGTGTSWVYAGYHGPQTTVGFFRPGSGPCYDCLQVLRHRNLAASPTTTPWQPGVDLPDRHAANAISSGLTGYLAAHVAIALITGVPRTRPNHEFGFNLVTLESVSGAVLEAPLPDCPTCRRH
jgi:molybdopterin/thiamine biosynthesis adenylyltransferase